ncbi:MAG TPA: hypothetical protein DHW02_13510 [Ktedonobacter sp.]|nr:hypothetical protein [Ktedonobacter sp.]
MSSSYKPTPEQQEQESKEKWAQLRNYRSLHGEQTLASPPASPASPSSQVPQTPVAPMTQPDPSLKGQGGRAFEPPYKGTGYAHRPAPTVRTQQRPEVEGNNVVLYRSSNFYLRTVNRVGQKVAPLHRPAGYVKTMADQQVQRMEATETRVMPNVAPINPKKKGQIPVPGWFEAIVIVAGLLVVLVVHALNMFNYPRYELDEGTYISSAWAILHGLITPYAYGYGHPPLAWIQIAAWIQFTGGFFTFGNALNSGRVLMLIYAVASALLVYLIVRRMGMSRSVALLAMALFSLSPLSVDYQRQILLDNIAVFWFLLSIYLLAVGNSRLGYIAGASIAFGISILSKEVMVLFIPGMIYAAWLHSTKFQRKFALVSFIYAFTAIGSMFILMAILRGELFPDTWNIPFNTHQHLSLLDTYLSQVKRTQSEGSFANAWQSWISQDKWLVLIGIASLGFNLVMGWWNRKQLLFALLAMSFWVLIVRGGVVLPFYYIPIIPLAAINIALMVNTISGWVGKLLHFDFIRAVLVLALVLCIFPYYYYIGGYTYAFTQHPTSAQDQAMTWVRDNVPNSAFIVINSYLYMDLRTDGGAGVGDGAPYPYAHVYFNVATDPTIYQQLLDNNYDRIDYIVADSEMINDINNDPVTYKIILQALKASVLRVEYKTDDQNSQIDIKIYQVVHKYPQPIVYGSGTSHEIAQSTMPIDRRNYVG